MNSPRQEEDPTSSLTTTGISSSSCPVREPNSTTTTSNILRQTSPTYSKSSTPSPFSTSTNLRTLHDFQQAQQRSQQQLQQRRNTYNQRSSNLNITAPDGTRWWSHALSTHDGWDTGEYTTTFRLGSINIGGISQYNNWIDWEVVISAMNELQLDVLGLTELGVNFKNSQVLSSFIEATHHFDRHMKIHTSCSNQLLRSTKKRGGTLCAISGRWTPRVLSRSSDSKGRWNTITLQGKGTRKVTIITCYRVCPQKAGGTCTISDQQYTDFAADGDFNVNLRRRFITDLTSHIRTLQQLDHFIILNGDMNEDLNKPNNAIAQMLRDCGLINIFHHFYDETLKMPATYDRGQSCLDLIAISNDDRLPPEGLCRVGMAPFHYKFNTDHRLLYCDFNTNLLFGYIRHDTTRPVFRNFSSSHVQKSTLYVDNLREYYTKSKVWTKWSSLRRKYESLAGSQPTVDLIKETQALEALASSLMKPAARKLGRTPYPTGKPFSSKLSQAAKSVTEAKIALKKTKKQFNYNIHNTNIQDSIEAVRNAHFNFRAAQQNATTLRNEFLDDLKEKRALQWNMTSAAALKVIIRAEASRKTFARHGRYMKPLKKGSIRSLLIPTPDIHYKSPCGTDDSQKDGLPGWTEIHDEDLIYHLLLRQNANHLNQSVRSPFAFGPIGEGVGHFGIGALSEQLLNGVLDDLSILQLSDYYPQFQPELPKFLQALTRPLDENSNPLPRFKWKFEREEFQALFRKTRESTSCGPSGLHMSHWKVIAEVNDLSDLWAWLISVAFTYGFSYPRWEVSFHCMLQKRDRPYIHRLRIIQLFEGDFNGALKYLLGRRLMYYMADKKQIMSQCFGSIPGKSAQEAMITLQLLYDNYRLYRKILASMFNDATGCYDLIRQNLGSVTMQLWGCPESIALCHTVTQLNLRHHVKTNFGISPAFATWVYDKFRNSTATPGFLNYDQTTLKSQLYDNLLCFFGNFGGVGQGAGGSPVIWLSVLLVMIRTYCSFESGAPLWDALGLYAITIYILSYVDDNSLVRSFPSGTSTSRILSDLKSSITRWRRLLQITGGDLSLEKCSYCIMKWRWFGSHPVLETPASDPGTLTIDSTEILRLNPNNGIRNLGIRLAMSGSFADELDHRISQSKQMGSLLYNAPLTPNDCSMVYSTRFLTAMRYFLELTNLSSTDLLKIQKPFIHKLLPKLSVNRHTALAIIHGPISHGGLGLVSLELEQAISHLHRFIGHLRRNDDLATSFRISLNALQLISGCGDFFLHLNPDRYTYVDKNNRLGYLWQICHRYQLTLHITGAWIPRDLDPMAEFIMDLALADPWYSTIPNRLHSINACRLYLRAHTTSDLLGPNNRTLRSGIFNGRYKCPSPYTFPEQGKPTAQDWNIWTQFLKRSILHFSLRDGGFLLQRPILSTPRRPSPYVPSSGEFSDLSQYINSTSYDFHTICARLPPRLRVFLGDVTFDPSFGPALLHSLRHGNLLAGSDGSYNDTLNTGTFAYKLRDTSNSTISLSGSGYTPKCDNGSSSPSEHCGLLGLLLALHILLHCFDRPSTINTSITLQAYLDNTEVIGRGSSDPSGRNISAYMKKDYDYWRLLRSLHVQLPLTLLLLHVKSHQTKAPQNESERLGRIINDEVDQLATSHYTQPGPPSQRHFYSDSVVSVEYKNNVIQLLRPVLDALHSLPALQAYYLEKGFSAHQQQLVDWPSLSSYLNEVTEVKRCNAIQYIHRWQNVGAQKATFLASKLRSQKKNDNPLTAHDLARIHKEGLCPAGCLQQESQAHFFHCSSRSTAKLRTKALGRLRTHLQNENTAPPIIKIFIDGISHFCSNARFQPLVLPTSADYLPDLDIALEHQHSIGWDRFIRGFLATKWKEPQSHWYQLQQLDSSIFNSSRWMLQVQRGLHAFWFELWTHRNTFLHGGHQPKEQHRRRHRLRARVRALYKKPRGILPLSEHKLFKVPLHLMLNRGNEQLSLWIKRCELVFAHHYNLSANHPPQQEITSYLQNWSGIQDDYYSASDDSSVDSGPRQRRLRQTTLSNWMKSWADRG